MGYPKFHARWYASHWLDPIVWRTKDRSAEQIIPERQTPAVGDRIPDSPDWSAFFTVQPPRTRTGTDPVFNDPPAADVHRRSVRLVIRARRRHGSTRLILRSRAKCTPVWPALVVWLFFGVVTSLGDLLEAGSMLHGGETRVTAHSTAQRDLPPRR